MFVNLNIPAFGELMRKCVFGFCFRLDNCKVNNIIRSIARSSVIYSSNVGSGGTRFCIDMHFYTNVALENVLRATMIFSIPGFPPGMPYGFVRIFICIFFILPPPRFLDDNF